jgi:hypothetical protein
LIQAGSTSFPAVRFHVTPDVYQGAFGGDGFMSVTARRLVCCAAAGLDDSFPDDFRQHYTFLWALAALTMILHLVAIAKQYQAHALIRASLMPGIS